MKKVNVTANSPVHGVEVTPIIGVRKNVEYSEDQIYRCLVGGAYVDEVLNSGNTIRLNFTNYNKVNEEKIVIKPEALKLSIPPVKTDEPVNKVNSVYKPDEEVGLDMSTKESYKGEPSGVENNIVYTEQQSDESVESTDGVTTDVEQNDTVVSENNEVQNEVQTSNKAQYNNNTRREHNKR